MKILLVVILSWISVFSYCQNNEPAKIDEPISAISNSKAKRRVAKYVNLKKRAILKTTGKQEIENIPYSKSVFVDLLTNLTSSNNHSGFRVYFGTYPDIANENNGIDSGYNYIGTPWEDCNAKKNNDSKLSQSLLRYSDCFTLIFVPTFKAGSTEDFHEDDIKNCYIVTNNRVEHIDASISSSAFISKWISKYRLSRMLFLDKDGNGHLNKGVFTSLAHHRYFSETESIWYPGESVTNNEKTGLLDYLKALDDKVSCISAKLAGYLTKSDEWAYKLTLVFGIKIKTENKEKEVSVALESSTQADTGRPCPPPTICPKAGANLPVQ